ncbi:MAG: 30S ribosome-binding factor RbfA [Nitrospira sp.]|nr:30S ribosome-binding factor RbfA [Nitrospira sp.]
MLPYKRSKRVGDLLREEIADIVFHRLKDPRIGFITITGVDVTDDIKFARVYLSIFKDEDKDTTLEILNSATSFIRSELSKRLRMKFIPNIEFRIDTSIEYGIRIDKLLDEIKRKSEGS